VVRPGGAELIVDLDPFEAIIEALVLEPDVEIDPGNEVEVAEPVEAPPSTVPPFVDLAPGATHVCGRTEGRTVYCWGDNESGQIGDGTFEFRSKATPVVGLAGVVQIATGDQFSCALRHDGTVWCWGSNGQGALGDDAVARRAVAAPVKGLARVVRIEASQFGACARLTGGQLTCWGNTARPVGPVAGQ